MPGITVTQAKRFGVLSCTADDLLVDAARTMADEDVSALVVTDPAGYLEGIITRTDVLRAITRNAAWHAAAVGDFMQTNVVTVGPETTMHEVAGILIDRQIHRVVVAREEGERLRPTAVVSAADCVYHLVKQSGNRSINPGA